MAVFNAPNKLPDHASAGLQCAVAIQRAVRKHFVLVNGEAKPIRVRVGVHTASILAGEHRVSPAHQVWPAGGWRELGGQDERREKSPVS